MNWLQLSELAVLLAIAFFLPIHARVVTYLIAAFVLLRIISSVRTGVQMPKLQYLPFAFLYLLYVFGLIYTSNFDFAYGDLETRMTFIVLPIFFALPKAGINFPRYYFIYAFILGLAIFQIMCYYDSYKCFEGNPSRPCLEGAAKAGGMHPTYLGMYICAGIMWLIYDVFANNRHIILKIVSVPLVIAFLHWVYMLYSVGPWISFVASSFIVLFAIFYFKKRLLWFFVGSAVVAVSGVLAIANLDLLNSDYRVVRDELKAYYADSDNYIEENSDNPKSVKARIIIWNLGAEFIANNPGGVGTGDVKDELIKLYRDRGMNTYAEHQLNPHNQYMQTAVAIGWLGLLTLFGAMIYYIYYSWKTKDIYLLSLSSLFAVGCLFESLFERQSGILFFMFFLMLFLATNLSADSDMEEIS